MPKHNSYQLQNGCWNCFWCKNEQYCIENGSFKEDDPDWSSDKWEREMSNRLSLKIKVYGICNLWKNKK